MTTLTGIGVALELGCNYDDACAPLARGLMDTMDSGKYDLCSVMEIPESIDDWRSEHRTARKRAHRARVRGYVAATLRRELHADDIYEINVSKSHRQGRPMAPAYYERQEFSPLPDYRCDRHAIRTTGVFEGTILVAYLTMYRCGDLALVSQILGHGAHEKDEIMFLLFEKALEREIGLGGGFVVYNRHDSGTKGLREFKEHFGLREQPVEWLP